MLIQNMLPSLRGPSRPPAPHALPWTFPRVTETPSWPCCQDPAPPARGDHFKYICMDFRDGGRTCLWGGTFCSVAQSGLEMSLLRNRGLFSSFHDTGVTIGGHCGKEIAFHFGK